MKVYLLMEDTEDGCRYVSVHSTKEKATEQIEIEINDLDRYYKSATTLNEAKWDTRKSLFIKEVQVDPEGVQMP